MNLESNSTNKSEQIVTSDDLDFDFKPITSGLGFHNEKTTDIKPSFHEGASHISHSPSIPTRPVARRENKEQIYQNDLSLFYGRESTQTISHESIKEEKIIRLATKSQRVLAYVLDLGFLLSCLGLVLTIMARMTDMDLMDVWTKYPNEITPLVVILFAGFYLMYFSIFEKTAQSTIGKNLLGIKVLDLDNKIQSFTMLMFRSFISLMNFVSLGLFSYFNLQNKVSNTKVVKAE